MGSQQSSDMAGNKEVLDATVVSTASDWPDNVFFDSPTPLDPFLSIFSSPGESLYHLRTP
jgi:hypothetical protein